jgi:hypothetical protein
MTRKARRKEKRREDAACCGELNPLRLNAEYSFNAALHEPISLCEPDDTKEVIRS